MEVQTDDLTHASLEKGLMFKGKFDSHKIFQWNLSNYGLRIMKC